MKIQYVSDIHHERFNRKEALPITPRGDVLVLAGDITDCPKNFALFLQKLKGITNVPVIMVLGNHEFYYGDFDTSIRSYRKMGRMYYPDLHIIDDPVKDAVKIDGVTFTGGTLWTDYANGTHLKASKQVMWEITDIPSFMYNQVLEPCLDTGEVAMRHQLTKDGLHQILYENEGKPTVVVTHHSPSFSLVTEKFLGDRINGAFHSNCDDIILEYSPNLWIYGHTHVSGKEWFGNTLLVSNQHGYKGTVDRDFQWCAMEEVEV